MAINDELKKIYLDANDSVLLIRTIELSHPSFSKTWYLCQDSGEFTAQLEDTTPVTYIPWGFDFKLPEATTKGQTNAQFVIDATDSTILDELWAYKANPTIPIVLKWREYFSNNVVPQIEAIEVKLMNIEFSYNQIKGAGSKPDIVNRPFPNRRYDQTILKGLKYV